MLSRRRMLGLLAAGALSARAGSVLAGGQPLMRILPRTGIAVPVVGLGTWRTFDRAPGDPHYPQIREVLRHFYAQGGRLVDSSPMYGRAETTVGELTAELGQRDRLFAATKVWIRGREAGERQMGESMRRMGADPMDLMQVHNLVDWESHLSTLRDWQAAGRVRHVGITHYTVASHERLEAIIAREPLDTVQVNYSLAVRDAERRLLPLAAERGVGVVVNRPFEGGALFSATRDRPLPEWAAEIEVTTWAQFFLKYLVAHPAVTCVIPATRRPHHLLENMAAGRGPMPDEPTRRRMAALVETL